MADKKVQNSGSLRGYRARHAATSQNSRFHRIFEEAAALLQHPRRACGLRRRICR